MDNNTPAAIPWYESRITWVQIVAVLFGVASFFGLDLGARLGMNEVQTVAAIMSIIPVVTMVIRWTHPNPTIVATKAKAEQINLMAAGSPTTDCDPPATKPASRRRR